ncbi:MAG: hypothetical protein ABR551_04300 [Gemmatimonadales bacterium]
MTAGSPAAFGVAVLVGLLSGLHAATWGMYKDSPYEGFSTAKYLRSPLVGMGAALCLQAIMRFDLASPAGLLMLFGLSYALERALVESHKSFIRVEDQAKYFIPMAFAVGGRVVASRALRAGAGLAYVGAIALVIAGLHYGGRSGVEIHPLAGLLLAGTAGGWLSAFGGAWKDAPKEGFQLLKFFRSPAIALVYALALASLTTSWLVISFGALGLTVATIETRKTFGTTDAPGKFRGKPILFPEALLLRRRFVPVFIAVWVLVLTALVAALANPRGGLLDAAWP